MGYNNNSAEYTGYNKDGYAIVMHRSSEAKVVVYDRRETRRQFREIRHLAPMAGASEFMFQFVFDVNGEKFCSGDFYHFFNSSIEDAIRGRYMPDFNKYLTSDLPAEFKTDLDIEREKPGAYGDSITNIHNRMYVEVQKDMEYIMADKAKRDTGRKIMIPIRRDIFLYCFTGRGD